MGNFKLMDRVGNKKKRNLIQSDAVATKMFRVFYFFLLAGINLNKNNTLLNLCKTLSQIKKKNAEVYDQQFPISNFR